MIIRAALGLMAAGILALAVAAWHWHGEVKTAQADAALARAELAGLRLEKAARDAAHKAQEAARAENEQRERENAEALTQICGDDLADADYFRALDGLLHQTAGAAADPAGCGPARGLPAPGGQ